MYYLPMRRDVKFRGSEAGYGGGSYPNHTTTAGSALPGLRTLRRQRSTAYHPQPYLSFVLYLRC